ncbi:MAG: winged helix-turn-helix transcriptional regulator [Burkholderiales bacterium]|nr:MAG: winged helix-turn-helix transcriptional regulator [Burkholderiales bacterium]
MKNLPPEAMSQVAAYFQALSEPTRLQLLSLLCAGERNVGDLAELTGFTAANVSRHLAVLARQGVVEREARGTAVYYRIGDPSVFALCDLVCGNIARKLESAVDGQKLFRRAARPVPKPSGRK